MSTENKNRLKSLDALPHIDSGYKDLHYRKEQELRYKKALKKMLTGKNEELFEELQMRPDLLDSLEMKSIFILCQLILGKEIKERQVFPFMRNEFISDSISKTIVNLYKNIYMQVHLPEATKEAFNTINLYSIKEVLPALVVYFTDLILVEKLEQFYDEAFKVLEDKEFYEKLTEDDLKTERVRHLSLYYRRKGDEAKAEEVLLQYRELYLPDMTKPVKLKKMPNTKFYPPGEVLDNLGELYQEIKDIQAEVCEISGVNNDSCMYFECSDCCHKDYPILYYSEYKYLVQKMEEDGMDIEAAKADARKIQAEHKAKYGFELPVVNKHRPTKEDCNPYDFKFSCPLLADNGGCGVHQIRPMMCRAYGLSSSDSRNVQACNYYLRQHQYNSNSENIRYVYDVRPYVAMIEASDQYQTEQDLGEKQKLCGTFVAWLSSDY